MAKDAEDSNGAGEHPLKLEIDISDWVFAGERLNRVAGRLPRLVGGLGGSVSPSDAGPAQELAQLIASFDVELKRHWDVWTEIIRPRLTKFEAPPPLPDWLFR